MKPPVSTFAIALIICTFTAAVAQPRSDPMTVDARSQAEARRIVASREFQRAARSKDIPRMNRLLRGTGAVATNPVALFFCRLPAIPVYRNGQWYCEGGGISLEVEPFMYQ
jgi:hypothetical protein